VVGGELGEGSTCSTPSPTGNAAPHTPDLLCEPGKLDPAVCGSRGRGSIQERCCRRWQSRTGLPSAGTGEPQSVDGATRTGPPQPSGLRPPGCTRETAGGRRRRVGRRPGRPQRNAQARPQSRRGPRSRSPGKLGTAGGGLTAQAPSLRKDRTQGTQRTRKLSTGHALWSWREGKDRCVGVRRRTAGAKPYPMQVVRTVCNGGHEETYGNATRLVPTQLRRSRFRRQVSFSVRQQRT
jgi:hypothetical protein